MCQIVISDNIGLLIFVSLRIPPRKNEISADGFWAYVLYFSCIE